MRARITFAVAASCLAVSLTAAQTAKPAPPASPKPPAQTQRRPTTTPGPNDEIIDLVKAKMREEIILAAVAKADRSKYDTSAAALLKLQNAGVSQRVIAAMMGIGDTPPPPLPPPPGGGDGGNGSDPTAKPKMAVKTFENPATSGSRSTIGNAVTGIFLTELGKTGRFSLLEREASADYVVTGTVANFSFKEDSEQREVQTGRGAALETMYRQTANVRVELHVTRRATGEFVLTDSGSATQSNLSATSEIATFRRYEAGSVSSTEASDSLMGRTTIEAIKNVVRKVGDLARVLSGRGGTTAVNLVQLLREAERYLEDGHYPQAVASYERALTTQANSAEVMGRLFGAYLYNKQLTEAEDLTDNLLANRGTVALEFIHEHVFGRCMGPLSIASDGISYRPASGDHGFTAKAADIVSFGQGTIPGNSSLPSLVIRLRDAKGKNQKLDFLATTFFKTPGSVVFTPTADPEALRDTEKVHRILIRVAKQIK